MKKRTKIIIAVSVAVIAVLGIASGIYASNYYHAVGVEAYMASSGGVTVTQIDEGYWFDGPSEDKALIFYPGAKVEETAYAPMMKSLAEQGVDCFPEGAGEILCDFVELFDRSPADSPSGRVYDSEQVDIVIVV